MKKDLYHNLTGNAFHITGLKFLEKRRASFKFAFRGDVRGFGTIRTAGDRFASTSSKSSTEFYGTTNYLSLCEILRELEAA